MSASEIPDDVKAFVDRWLGDEWRAEPLAGDASVRQYFRVFHGAQQFMLAYYPEAVRAGVERFVAAYRAIEQFAAVPAVLHQSESLIAQADVGNETLFDLVGRDPQTGAPLYGKAVELLVSFQRAGDLARELNPPFTPKSFRDELEMTRNYYLTQLLSSSESEAPELLELLDRLSTRVGSHPYLLCHRDYHGQNIHVFNESLYMIDYQDMRMGPDTYDLASLLRDRGIAKHLGHDREEELISYYAGLIGAGASLRQRYFETLLQRSIKILGTFARQAISRGKNHYLDFIPPTLESIGRCIEELPEFEPFEHFFPLRSERQAAAS